MNRAKPMFQPERFRNYSILMREVHFMGTLLPRISALALCMLVAVPALFGQQTASNYIYISPTDTSVPPAPTLSVVPGDGKVTLYWDDAAESFEDPYLATINRQNRRNFEGYRVYKSTDPEFLDALRVTDNQGNVQGYRPIAQFDLENRISGYHPASINGVRFWIGNDTGLERFFVDEDVLNGRTYYYAVVAFTHGDARPNFELPLINPVTSLPYDPPLFPNQVYRHSPRESGLDVSVNRTTGQIQLGRNVVRVVPNAPVAGYIEPTQPQVQRISGSAGGDISVQVIDPAALKLNNQYSLTFQDTIIPGATALDPDRISTKSFTLTNITTGDVIFNRDPRFRNEQLQIREGILLSITSSGDSVSINPEFSNWIPSGNKFIHDFNFGVNTRFAKLADYRLEFSDGVVSTSRQYELRVGQLTQNLPAEEVNFRVINTTTNEEIPFAFLANPQIPRDLRDVFFLNANTGWTVGGAGQLRKTTDGGLNWRALSTGTDRRLTSIFFHDENNGVAVGERGEILATFNGGETWIRRNSGVTSDLSDVHFVSTTTGIATGLAGLILRTTDGGETWVTVPSGSPRNLRRITFIDNQIGFVVGNNAAILRTTDAGQTWSVITMSGTVGDLARALNDVYFLDSNNGWAVGASGIVWSTTNGGLNWGRRPAFNNTELLRIYYSSTQNGIAIGLNGQIIRTTNGGTNWVLQTSGTQVVLYGLYAKDANNIVVVGQGPTILTTSNGGVDWTRTTAEKRFRANFDANGQARSDEIYFIEDFGDDTGVITWKVSMSPDIRGQSTDPGDGDVLELVTIKPFTRADEFRFTITEANAPQLSSDIPENVLQQIRVVPNPYVVSHIGETKTYGPGASENALHFINLPSQCTIRIFNVSGQLVQTLNIDNNFSVNRYVWDMKNASGHSIPYGVYIYLVTAPGIGEHTGKFAVIK